MGGDVGNVEARQHFLGGLGVVVGRAADKREAGQRDQASTVGRPFLKKNFSIAGRASRPVAIGGNDSQAAGLERGDDAVVVGGVAGEDIGPHDEQADGALLAFAGRRQHVGALGDAARQPRVIDADVGIFGGRRAASACRANALRGPSA